MAKIDLTTGSSYESVLKKATKEKVSFLSLSKIYPAYITLFITLFVSIGLWQLVDSQLENENITAFDKAVSSVMKRFESQYQKNYQVLESVRGLYDELVDVTRDYFNLYSGIPTKTQPSLLGVIFSPRIYNDDMDFHYYNVRSQGIYDYEIVPDGYREEYYPIQFIVPPDSNLHRFGFDLGTVPTIKDAIIKAMETKNTISTPLFQVRPDTLGFYLISPFFKRGAKTKTKKDRIKNYEGSVILEINSEIFFKKSLGLGNPSDTSIIFQCFNSGTNEKLKIVFESKNIELLKTDYEPDLTEEHILKIADKDIKVQFSTIPDFGGSFNKILPLITLSISLVLSFLAFAFIVNVINRKQSALSLAERMTRSQRRIVESSNDIIAVMDLDGTWKSMNPACIKILSYQPDELVNQKIDKLFATEKQKNEFYRVVNEPSDTTTQKIDVQMLSKEGEIKWVSFSLSVSRIEGLIYTTGRDVTLEKIAEAQEQIRNKQVMLAEQLSREASEYKSNFFAKLSLQLRNSLTGILGYLDLISFKVYETDKEHDEYIDEASKSSKEILSFVTSTSDTWGISDSSQGETESIGVMTPIKLEKPLTQAFEKFTKEQKEFQFEILKGIKDNIAVTNLKKLSDTVYSSISVLSEGLNSGKITSDANELADEDVTQIKITVSKNELVSEMINLYNKNESDLIGVLGKDKSDIILRLAINASDFRMMNGKIILKSTETTNELLINLPNKIQQEEGA